MAKKRPRHTHDRRRDRAKRIEELVTIDRGTLGALALRYLQDLTVRNYSPHTIRSARIHLRLFLVWCEERGLTQLEELTLPLLRRYQTYLFHYRKENGRRLSFINQSDRLAGIRRFAKWLHTHEYLDTNPGAQISLPRVSQRLPQTLSAEEAESVLAQPDVETPLGLRDRAMIELLYSTGLRRGELERLGLDEVDLVSGIVRVVEGKGGKDRLVPLSERAAAWIERYVEEVRPSLVRPPRDPEALLLGRWGRPLHACQIGKLVRTYVKASGIGKEGSCHLFRHTLATLMLEGGADIRFIQKMLGHATLQSTEIYTHVAIRKLQEVHAATHPGAKLSRPERP